MTEEPEDPWSGQQWQKIIQHVKSPLGFFVLIILILFAFAAAVLWSEIPMTQKIAVMWAALGIMIAIVALIAVLIIKFPRNLVFTDTSHIRYAEITKYGSNQTVGLPASLNSSTLIEHLPPSTQPDKPLLLGNASEGKSDQ